MDIFSTLRESNEEVSVPLKLPTELEVDAIENKLGVKFPSLFREYLLKVSDVVFGDIEPVTIISTEDHTYLPVVANDAWAAGVPKNNIPICEDNGDYYCVTPVGKVVFWSHDGASDESWSDIKAWIQDVWLEL